MAIAIRFMSTAPACGGASRFVQAGIVVEPMYLHNSLFRSTTKPPQPRLKLTMIPLSTTRGSSSSAPWYGARMCGWIIMFSPPHTVTTPRPALATVRMPPHRLFTASLS